MASLRIKSRQWIVDEDDHIIIGEGRKEIFEHIQETGSINQTAKVMRMSYKGVWSKIKATEKSLNMKIVDTDRKRGTRLTKEGKELLEKYSRLKKACVKLDNRVFEEIFGQVGDESEKE
ncbi:MAG: LysR family transcriptional regulator [Deltaproteobacteria bacterium]|nr:LysR family transcriptional regulator [Deltaproteobacteria bacterium]